MKTPVKDSLFDDILAMEREVPAHRRAYAQARQELAKGYAWGRQDERGEVDAEETIEFAYFAYAQALAYVTERRTSLPSVSSQWDEFQRGDFDVITFYTKDAT